MLCKNLWVNYTNKQAAFGVDKSLSFQLHEYLRRKAEPHSSEIGRAVVGTGTRHLLIFKFPYPDFNAVLDDLRVLNFGEKLVVWDRDGRPIKV